MMSLDPYNPSPSSGRRITPLDGLRGISILCVIIGHLIHFRFNPYLDDNEPGIPGVLSVWGVDIFFVISGFIITKLALQETSNTGNFNVYRFYIRRFFRIIPAFYFYLLFIAFASAMSWIVQTKSGILFAASFSCNIPEVSCGWFVGHSWTLAYEEQFYLCFPILFYLTGKRFKMVVTSIFLFFLLIPAFQHFGYKWAFIGFSHYFLFINAGCLVAVYETTVAGLLQTRYAALLSFAMTATLIVSLFFASVSFPFQSCGAYIQSISNILGLPICFSWLIAFTAFQKSSIARVLNSSFLQFFGKISYSLYIWQMAFTGSRAFYPQASWLLFPPFMFVLALLSHSFVELPGMRLGKRLLTFFRARHHRLSVSLEKEL